MTQVDFLPESFHRAQQRRGRLFRQIILLGATVGCLAVASLGLRAHTANQLRTAERLEATVESERTAMGLINGLDHERKELLKTFDLKRELDPPVTYSQVLAIFGHVLPEAIAVTELSMTSVRPKPEPLAVEEARGRKQNEETEKVEEPHLIGLELRGLAPDDLAVARLVSALDEHPMFERVTMRSSEGVQTQGVIAREFSLTATVDLDREFRWTDHETEEVAHAD
ncbi:MAG: PilN domain-containing protein [Planctomycetota bacterium]